MASTSTSFRRGCLRNARIKAGRAGTPLYDYLLGALEESQDGANVGMNITQTQSNRTMVSYQIAPRGQGYSPADIAETIEGLVTLCEDSKQTLIDRGTPTPTDDQVFQEMLARLVPCVESMSDFTLLRVRAVA